jgi:hypothetical protein
MEAMHELLHHEVTRRERFERDKYIMTMPRNPLTGEETPREDDPNVPLIIPKHNHGFKTYRLKDSPRVSEKIGCDGRDTSNEFTRSMQRPNSLSKKQNQMDLQIDALNRLIEIRENNVMYSLEMNKNKYKK